jgi:hypothetical protein
MDTNRGWGTIGENIKISAEGRSTISHGLMKDAQKHGPRE